MSDAITYWVELLVGLGCFGVAGVAIRADRGWFGAALVIAGLLAVGHAVAKLTDLL